MSRACGACCSRTKPDDYVLATGETHSVREFVERAFAEVGIAIAWKGSGVKEQGVDKSNGRVLVEVDPRYFRPAEVDMLCGDATKAREKLGWTPKEKFADLVKEMVRHDVQLLEGPLSSHALLIAPASRSSAFCVYGTGPVICRIAT